MSNPQKYLQPKRDLFTELAEGFDALAKERQCLNVLRLWLWHNAINPVKVESLIASQHNPL